MAESEKATGVLKQLEAAHVQIDSAQKMYRLLIESLLIRGLPVVWRRNKHEQYGHILMLCYGNDAMVQNWHTSKRYSISVRDIVRLDLRAGSVPRARLVYHADFSGPQVHPVPPGATGSLIDMARRWRDAQRAYINQRLDTRFWLEYVSS